MAAQQAQAAINAQQQIELGKIPVWYGDKTKDAFLPEHWIDRIEHNRINAPWTDAQACNFFYQALRGKAVAWWNLIRDNGIDTAVWANVRREFLGCYGSTITERTAVTNLRIQQGATESCMDFGSRVNTALQEHRITALPLPAVADADLNNALWPGMVAADLWHANATNDMKRNILNHVRNVMMNHERDIMARNVFISGLRPLLREKMMAREDPLPFMNTLMIAAKLERQLTDPSKGQQVTEVEDEDVEAIRRNNKLSRGGKRPFSSDKKTLKCYYCGIPGHTQANCYKRKRENGQWKDKDGKPLPFRKKINEVDADKQGGQPTEAAKEGHSATTENELDTVDYFQNFSIFSISENKFHLN